VASLEERELRKMACSAIEIGEETARGYEDKNLLSLLASRGISVRMEKAVSLEGDS